MQLQQKIIVFKFIAVIKTMRMKFNYSPSKKKQITIQLFYCLFSNIAGFKT